MKQLDYDGSGNPTSYYNGTRWTFGWEEGRNLVSAAATGKQIFYTYDHEGIRTSKTVNGTTHNYVYASGKLLRETYGENVLDFFYDANGRPFALNYNGTVYYYILNVQGDVLRMVDVDGNVVASYKYDPYGNIISATGNLAEINPLRYRGYYYDSDSHIYYLNSRYYDPAIGRFINADEYVSTGQGVSGNNMFVYCGNNPIGRVDIGGDVWETVFDIATLCFSMAEVACNPADIGAWISLGCDFLDLIPFVTGLGETTRVLRGVDRVVDGFGALSKAKEYGIKSYNALRKSLKGTGLQAHHIIEQRLVRYFDIDVNSMLSVAVTPAEHQKFTNAWRQVFKYGTDYRFVTKDDIWEAAQKIYEDYPEILDAAKRILYG